MHFICLSHGSNGFTTYYGIWWVDKSHNNSYRSSYRWDVEKKWWSYRNSMETVMDIGTVLLQIGITIMTQHFSTVGFLPRQQASGSVIEVYGHYGADAEL